MRRAVLPGALALITLALAVTCVAQDAILQAKGAYLNEIRTQLSVTEKANRSAEQEIAALTQPALLKELAETELGMVRATEEDVVYYNVIATVEAEPPVETEKDGGIFSAFQRLIAKK